MDPKRNINIVLFSNMVQDGYSEDGIACYSYDVKNEMLVALFRINNVDPRNTNDTLYDGILTNVADSDYIEYDYNIDYKNRNVVILEYYPFKPLTNKYAAITKKCKIEYSTIKKQYVW